MATSEGIAEEEVEKAEKEREGGVRVVEIQLESHILEEGREGGRGRKGERERERKRERVRERSFPVRRLFKVSEKEILVEWRATL